MGILDEDIPRVREASDIVALVTEHLQLKRVGSRWTGLCPFHTEKSPSFSVNAEEGLYYCFGCGAKGDVITFVREIEHLDFAAAVERLAARAGITLRYTTGGEGERRSKKSQMVATMEAAVAWYHERLLSSPDAADARKYLRGRGLDGEIVRQYRIGWAPDDWDVLVRDIDVGFERLVEVNLAILNKRNRRQDVFRNRILFPIFDSQGDPVAFGGRVLPGGDGPKYRNSSETPIYAKSKVLYGLNWAKGAIVEADEAIVCEGYTDVIGMARVGLGRAVAPCGTALTEDHVRLLTRFGKRIVLAFDADAAGENAAARFYEWEGKYEVAVRVAALEPGKDPGDLAQHDPDALRRAVEESVPFLRFRFDRALAGQDLTSPEGKARAADRVLPVIAEHPDEIVRDQYVMDLADRLHLDPDRLRSRLKVGARREVEVVERVGAPSAASGRELEALRLLIHRRAEIADRLDATLFADPTAREAYTLLIDSPSVQDAAMAAELSTQDLLFRLTQEEATEGPTAVDVAALLVKDALGRMSAEVRRTDDIALMHEINGLMDRIQVPDVDVTVVDKALELLRGHGRGSTDERGEIDE
ncbi:MAG: DNA primase [Acidimicrobiales bacterium]